jgi:hypothetical protein
MFIFVHGIFVSCTKKMEALTVVGVSQVGKGAGGKKPINKDRFIPKMFLRGDSVILVLRNPK